MNISENYLKVGGGPGKGGGGTGRVSGNLLEVGNKCKGCGTWGRKEVVGGWNACAWAAWEKVAIITDSQTGGYHSGHLKGLSK